MHLSNDVVLFGISGSRLYGTNTELSDTDYMGITCESLNQIINPFSTFEQYRFSTSNDNVKSGLGDEEGTIYSLRKWVKLAAHGNPSILQLAFIPDSAIIKTTEIGEYIREYRHDFLSKEVISRFIGFSSSQQKRLINPKLSLKVNRPALIEKYGFDVKYAGEMVRLSYQGYELMTTGELTFPLATDVREAIKDIRAGKIPLQDCLEIANIYIAGLKSLKQSNYLNKVDYDKMTKMLVKLYNIHWSEDV